MTTSVDAIPVVASSTGVANQRFESDRAKVLRSLLLEFGVIITLDELINNFIISLESPRFANLFRIIFNAAFFFFKLFYDTVRQYPIDG